MTAHKPIPDEIVSVLTNDQNADRMYSAGDIAWLVTMHRGATADTVSRNRVLPLLAAMAADGTLATATEGVRWSEDEFRDPALATVFGHSRHGATYYGLPQVADGARGRWEQRQDARRDNTEIALAVGEVLRDRVTRIQADDTAITITMTKEQAWLLFLKDH